MKTVSFKFCFVVFISFSLVLSFMVLFNPPQIAKADDNADVLPDLVINSIGVGSDNRISVTIRNNGGGLLEKHGALGEVYIGDILQSQFSLNSPVEVIGGGIETAGGCSIYYTDVYVQSQVQVMVCIDTTSSIIESDEDNNYLCVDLQPLQYEQTPTPTYEEIPTPVNSPKPTPEPTDTPEATPYPKDTPEQTPYPKDTPEQTPYPKDTPEPTPLQLTIETKSGKELEKQLENLVPFEISSTLDISGLGVKDITQNSATIEWTTSLEANGAVFFCKDSYKMNQSKNDATASKSHGIILTGLEAGVSYQYYVESVDAKGRKAVSKQSFFTTLPPIADVIIPVPVIEMPDIISSTQKIITNLPEPKKINRVVYLIDGIKSFTDYKMPFEFSLNTSKLSDGLHDLEVRAYDKNGTEGMTTKKINIRNTLNASESPVTVTINSPRSLSSQYNSFIVCAGITNSNNNKIAQVQIKDGNLLLYDYIYDKPISPDLFYNKCLNFSCEINTDNLSKGGHTFTVLARDDKSNWGSKSFELNIVETPTTLVSMTRRVVRKDNWMEVILTLKNEGEFDVGNLSITDTSTGYQCTGEVDSTSDLIPVNATFFNDGTYKFNSNICVKNFGTLARGLEKTIRYSVVPVLSCENAAGESFGNVIGTSTAISYSLKNVRSTIDLFQPWSDSMEYFNAVKNADYLIITRPQKLYELDSSKDTHTLMNTTAKLAQVKNGVLGYISGAYAADPFRFKELLNSGGLWSSRLCQDWNKQGYMLIVGENNMIPGWTVQTDVTFYGANSKAVINNSDQRYSDTYSSDCVPDIKLGRIIGNSSRDMTIPIQTSIKVFLRQGNYHYDGSKALLVSGDEGPWEHFVNSIKIIKRDVQSIGINTTVHDWEYYTTAKLLLYEALIICKKINSVENVDALDLNTLIRYMMELSYIKIKRGEEALYLNDAIHAAEQIQNQRRKNPDQHYYVFNNRTMMFDTLFNDFKGYVPDSDIIFFNGHGYYGAWSCGINTAIDKYSVSKLNFGNSNPVVIAKACFTGNYTKANVFPINVCEDFLRSGAGVYIGATEPTLKINEITTGFGEYMFLRYWKNNRTIGEIFTNFKRDRLLQIGYKDRASSVLWAYMMNVMNYYGDPKYGTP